MCRGGASRGGGGISGYTSDQITSAIVSDAIENKYSYTEYEGRRRYSQAPRTWEGYGQERIYVPSSAYGSAGYIQIRGETRSSGTMYKGVKLVPETNRPRERPNIEQLKGFVDDLQAELGRRKK